MANHIRDHLKIGEMYYLKSDARMVYYDLTKNAIEIEEKRNSNNENDDSGTLLILENANYYFPVEYFNPGSILLCVDNDRERYIAKFMVIDKVPGDINIAGSNFYANFNSNSLFRTFEKQGLDNNNNDKSKTFVWLDYKDGYYFSSMAYYNKEYFLDSNNSRRTIHDNVMMYQYIDVEEHNTSFDIDELFILYKDEEKIMSDREKVVLDFGNVYYNKSTNRMIVNYSNNNTGNCNNNNNNNNVIIIIIM